MALTQVQKAKAKALPVSKDAIRQWIKRDIETLYSLAYEILSTEGVVDILADKLYNKHLVDQAKSEEAAVTQTES